MRRGGHTCADECERHAAHHASSRVCIEFVACHEAAIRCARDPTASRAWTSCTPSLLRPPRWRSACSTPLADVTGCERRPECWFRAGDSPSRSPPRPMPHLRFEAIELRQEAALVSAAGPAPSASNVRMIDEVHGRPVPVSVRVASDEVAVQSDRILEPVLPHGMLDVLNGPLSEPRPTRVVRSHRCRPQPVPPVPAEAMKTAARDQPPSTRRHRASRRRPPRRRPGAAPPTGHP
jgi:hypothetical protein